MNGKVKELILITLALVLFFSMAYAVKTDFSNLYVKTLDNGARLVLPKETEGYTLVTDPIINDTGVKTFTALYTSGDKKVYGLNEVTGNDISFRIDFKPDPKKGKSPHITVLIMYDDSFGDWHFQSPEELYNYVFSFPTTNEFAVFLIAYYLPSSFIEPGIAISSLVTQEYTAKEIADDNVLDLTDVDSIELIDDSRNYTSYDFVRPQFEFLSTKWRLNVLSSISEYGPWKPKLFVKDSKIIDFIFKRVTYAETNEEGGLATFSKNFFVFSHKYLQPYENNNVYHIDPKSITEHEVSFKDDPLNLQSIQMHCVINFSCGMSPYAKYTDYFKLKQAIDYSSFNSLDVTFSILGMRIKGKNDGSYQFLEVFRDGPILQLPYKIVFFNEPVSLEIKNLVWGNGDPKKNLYGLLKSKFDSEQNNPTNRTYFEKYILVLNNEGNYLADMIPQITRPDGVVMTSPVNISPWFINCNNNSSTFEPFNGCMEGDYLIKWGTGNVFKTVNPSISLTARWTGNEWCTVGVDCPEAVISEPKGNESFYVGEPVIFSFVCSKPDGVLKEFDAGDCVSGGNISCGVNVTENDFVVHNYSDAGNYNANLEFDWSGATYSDSTVVNIMPFYSTLSADSEVSSSVSNPVGFVSVAGSECGFLGLNCLLSGVIDFFSSGLSVVGEAVGLKPKKFPQLPPFKKDKLIRVNVVDTVQGKGTIVSAFCDVADPSNPATVKFEVFDSANSLVYSSSFKCNGSMSIPAKALPEVGPYNVRFYLGSQEKENSFGVYPEEKYCG